MSSSCTTTILPGNLPSVLLSKAVAAVKRLYNILHQMVTHDITAVKLDDTDTLDTAQRLHRPRQAAVALVRQVDLRNVARDDELGTT